MSGPRRRSSRSAPVLPLALCLFIAPADAMRSSPLDCPAAREAPLLPPDRELCARLEGVIRRPNDLPLAEYEFALGAYLRDFCHRDADAGWKRDKRVRDTGPYTLTLEDGEWVGRYYGTHAPVVVWYSPEMFAWMKANRPADESAAPGRPEPVPDGAIMVKEMYPAPAAACAGVDPQRLEPTSGAAVMVRDSEASHDGWFWGWFGWSDWDPDWPPGPENRYPYMGFGQYCVNCHASAVNNLTFATLRNVEGEPGEPLAFLSQDFAVGQPPALHHRLVSLPSDDAPRLGVPHDSYDSVFTRSVKATSLPKPDWESVARMPSETYDNVWMPSGGPTFSSQFVTSDQCIGCHDAGGTGVQLDMTEPDPDGDELLNQSPYATWRTSPMGLAGRDPIFYAQLASETETFHSAASERIQDVCLGCHGIQGQRQFAIDGHARDRECGNFLRSYANAVPWPGSNPSAGDAAYGALARDGISCTACHHMVLGETDSRIYAERPQNRCVGERQALLNPDNAGFARTFTGSFFVGPADTLYGPFREPKPKPMQNALGIEPVHGEAISTSELCGTCHTVHLPVLHGDSVLGYTYEQTTYAEWAFSDYRTGTSPDGPLPFGPGRRARSCQDCHLPATDGNGASYRSKIAGIEESRNFPETDYRLPRADIDLEVREGFARHTLVGLNIFFVKMSQQFPDILGIRTQDPMLVGRGLDPLLLTERAMLDQASQATAAISLGPVEFGGRSLRVPVKVVSKTGHKFPSGVGFRRAFIEFSVLNEQGEVVWASGRTNAAGVIVDERGEPVAGEFWWKEDCSARLHRDSLVYQPHFQVITRQEEVQIYQELVTAPADTPRPVCGRSPTPRGELTTSFLSICGNVKDNRILPHGFLPEEDRAEIARVLGDGVRGAAPGRVLAEEAGAHGVGDDPDYERGGGDSLIYEVDTSRLEGTPASVRATLYYQAIPPYYLQDRFCTSKSADTQRLYFLTGHLNLRGTQAEDWKLEVVSTGPVGLP